MNNFLKILLCGVSLLSPLLSMGADGNWYTDGQAQLKRLVFEKPNTQKAKNIILFVGDGMGVSTVTAARIYAGQQLGMTGEEHSLAFEKLPYVGLSKTYNTNQQTSDSAGTMTAMMTGLKTKAGFISVGERQQRGDCKGFESNKLETLLEQFERAGRATGVVSTARITHATPAASYAHTAERNWESDADMPLAIRAQGCKDIAAQFVDFNVGDGIDVMMGGGRKNFLPHSVKDPENVEHFGVRQDGRDLTKEWQRKNKGGQYIWNQQQFDAVEPKKGQPLLALFERSHMAYEYQRKTGVANEPSLAAMTEKAIQLLANNKKGFLLIVEGGRIDHGHHASSAYRALSETVAFSKAVAKAITMTDERETLIVVTADHSHVMTLAGYPTRGNPILGKVVINDDKGNAQSNTYLAADGLPFTTLSYANGKGAGRDQGQQRGDLQAVDTEQPGYRQQAMIPLHSETHGGEDVAIYAGGPWAHLIRRTHEQNIIYHVMRHAAQLD